jgi:dTDP-4-dehydrorhamnose 3,5-epimerase
MQATRLAIPDVMLIEPKVFGDARGFFFESFNQRTFNDATGTDHQFVQDNHSRSSRGVLRGLHYQIQRPQGKLVRVVQGAVFDVVVDIRKNSPTFGRMGRRGVDGGRSQATLDSSRIGPWFSCLSESADFLYKTTDYYSPQHEHCILWDDPQLAIAWPDTGNDKQLSGKDQAGRLLAEADL